MSRGPATTIDRPHRVALVFAGAALALWLGILVVVLRAAALPDGGTGTVLAVFPPGSPTDERFAAIIRAGGQPVRQSWMPIAWIATSNEPDFVGRLKGQGVLAAFGEMPFMPVLGGCAVVVPTGKPPAAMANLLR